MPAGDVLVLGDLPRFAEDGTDAPHLTLVTGHISVLTVYRTPYVSGPVGVDPVEQTDAVTAAGHSQPGFALVDIECDVDVRCVPKVKP